MTSQFTMNRKHPTIDKSLDISQHEQRATYHLIQAQQILLLKAGEKDGEYARVRYVKMAARIAFNAILVAIDSYLKARQTAIVKRPKSIEDYRKRVAEYNQQLHGLLNAAYGELYLSGYYHGNPSKLLMARGLATAYEILICIRNSSEI
ncbi:DUF5618 family protein [Spirosoma utsteinense]|uniref:DUF5618 domain-containing protein n=1 Tax=Spirosoma utsteinense TaxID=2585773 RepID=A0ABR6WD09_9BACT|nr:DUF5618 family protein [Spirosoma utsteinense]MBC3788484.1 hypothetical protein [Spirosoma utsteinense]MBC3794452.1 hypothetical protein [Spirosoma utsteinense]